MIGDRVRIHRRNVLGFEDAGSGQLSREELPGIVPPVVVIRPGHVGRSHVVDINGEEVEQVSV